MNPQKLPRETARAWGLARAQHGVITRAQLLSIGLGPDSIKHRISKGRLHPLWRGVYAVGRPEVDQHGRWMAAVLSCGPDALLSHRSAAALWGLMRTSSEIEVDVVVPRKTVRRRPGIRVHRRVDLRPEHRRQVAGIPLTDPTSTLVDLASCVPEWKVERAINQADHLDLINPEALRAAIEPLPPRPGMACLRRLLGCDALTDSGLEHKFLALVRAAGLPLPETQAWVGGYRVDFYWPHIGLIVEADSWFYHRTPGAQATDHRRDQAHTAAGLTTVRFAENQIRYAPEEVKRRLATVVDRLASAPAAPVAAR
jgi:very-short-patch-repair endonuclease